MFANGYRLAPASKHPFSVDSWVFQYTNVIGNLDNIKIEINYLMRCHLLPAEIKPIKLHGFENVNVRTLALVELYASKVKALLERGAARDLFDVHNMIRQQVIGEEQKPMLRKGVVFYSAAGGNAKPTETYSLQPIERLHEDDAVFLSGNMAFFVGSFHEEGFWYLSLAGWVSWPALQNSAIYRSAVFSVTLRAAAVLFEKGESGGDKTEFDYPVDTYITETGTGTIDADLGGRRIQAAGE